jgi:hypothetical protein
MCGTPWHVLLLRQWHLRSSYVSIRMSGGAPVVVTTMDTLADCAEVRTKRSTSWQNGEARAGRGCRVVRGERWRVSVAHDRRGCRWVAPAASGHTLKSDRLFNSKSSKRTNPRLDTINRRGGERVRFVALYVPWASMFTPRFEIADTARGLSTGSTWITPPAVGRSFRGQCRAQARREARKWR